MKWRAAHLTFIFLLSIVLTGCGTSGSSGPVLPTQIPTSIEGIGGELSGDFTVMTGNTLSFVIENSDGEEVDASPVTVEISSPDGTVVADVAAPGGAAADKTIENQQCYGSTSTSGSTITYTAGDCFPNRESMVRIRFVYDDTEIGTANVYISVNPEAVEGGQLTFDSGTEVVSSAVNPGITVTDDGIVFVCARKGNYTESCGARGCSQTETSRSLVVLKSEDMGQTWSDPSVVTTWSTSSTLDSAAMCSISALDENTVAVGYPAIVTSTEQQCGREGCVDVEVSYDYYYVAFGSDGGSGLVFGTPVQVGRLSTTYESDSILAVVKDIGIALDSDGVAHAVYQTMEGVANVYYKNCTSTVCSDAIMVNSVSDSVSTANTSLPVTIAVTGTNAVSIYTAWQSTQDGSLYSSMYMGELAYSGGAARLVRNIRVDENQYGWTAGQNLIVDRDGRLVVTWSGVNRQELLSTIYIARLNEEGTAFGPNIAATELEAGNLPIYSSITTDYSDNYHIIFADYGHGPTAGFKYLMGSYNEGGDSADTFSVVPTIEILGGFSSYIEISARNDSAGRSYAVFYENEIVYIAVGTIR